VSCCLLSQSFPYKTPLGSYCTADISLLITADITRVRKFELLRLGRQNPACDAGTPTLKYYAARLLGKLTKFRDISYLHLTFAIKFDAR
jgi:hypothetical protein